MMSDILFFHSPSYLSDVILMTNIYIDMVHAVCVSIFAYVANSYPDKN